MNAQFYPAMTLLEAFDQLDDGLLQQAYNTDTAEKFHALAKVRPINAKQRLFQPRLSTVAACLAVIFVLALAPWALSRLVPMWIPANPTEPPEPPTTDFAEPYDSSAPPKLLVYGIRQSIWPVMTGYDWYYYPEPGNTTHEAVETSNPLSAEMADIIPWLTTDESTLVLKFQTAHSSIQVRCWEVGKQGDPNAYGAYQLAPCSNQSVQLMPGSYIYEVKAQWYPLADRQGTATYVFGVTANFEHQEPERKLTIQSGDLQLTDPVEKLTQGLRYDDAANQWVDVWDSGGYWTLVDAAQNGTPLPTLVFNGDLQVNLGPNGQLTAIRVYYTRDSATPGIYMFADTPQELRGLPAGQWYILMCVTWEGRFIEHQNACETYDYEYVFQLDVPQPETPPLLWDFDEVSGTLTVGGCESIPDYAEQDYLITRPWSQHWLDIQHIRVADGVKRIGNLAFRDLPNLQDVSLPDGLREIGDYAFEGAQNLSTISLPQSLEVIGDRAFGECRQLPAFDLPEGLKHIGQGAFTRCEVPNRLVIPASVETIGHSAFFNCVGLVDVTILGSPDQLTLVFAGCSALRIVRFCGDAPPLLVGTDLRKRGHLLLPCPQPYLDRANPGHRQPQLYCLVCLRRSPFGTDFRKCHQRSMRTHRILGTEGRHPYHLRHRRCDLYWLGASA